jgi:hypothetical protein
MGAVKINGTTSGSTTITAPASGGDETIELSTALASKLNLAGGKILQIVRATDSTQRTTTSTSFVDVTGMSVTITPQKSDSAILVFAIFDAGTSSADQSIIFRITDSSNNPLSGAEECWAGASTILYQTPYNLVGYATPATTSAVTYKLRFRGAGATLIVYNNQQTGQMYAIEVSA